MAKQLEKEKTIIVYTKNTYQTYDSVCEVGPILLLKSHYIG